MKLERLELSGFGRLAGFEADLHPRLTVLLGENESGKTTVHRALRAALYGLDAGGQGRPTDRSDWARWSPWTGGAYALALTYALADGRRLRVARRLEQREHVCQVHEIGGGDLTDQLRIGRVVSPGHVHLGIDEAVFCASACVGDDALRLGGSEAPAARAAQVQEAIERLADSGSSITATEGLLALQGAARRVGSERRLASPLGHAVNRLRQLDAQLDDARRRCAVLAAEEERLRSLEAHSRAAEQRRADAERHWLLGRLAALAVQRGEVEAATGEISHLAAEIEGNAHLAHVPLELEERLLRLAAELQEARRGAAEAAARAAAGSAPLAEVDRRRAEIRAGMQALAAAPVIDAAAQAEADSLREALAGALAGRRHGDELNAASARHEALRQEIARTGHSSTSAQSIDAALDLLSVARGGRRRGVTRRLASMALVTGAAVAAVALGTGHARLAAVAGGVAALGAVLALFAERVLGGDLERARRRLAELCPGAALDDEGLERLAARLPRLRALSLELQREQIRMETLAADLAGAERQLDAVVERAAALAARLDLDLRSSTDTNAATRVRQVLSTVDTAATVRLRLDQLEREDLLLAQRQADLRRTVDEAAERASASSAAEAWLRQLLDGAGIDRRLATAAALAAFRVACAGRLRHDQATRRLEEVRRRLAATGDRGTLERQRADLERRLRDRGGDLAEIAGTAPLAPAQLQELEAEAEHARQSAVAAATAAISLRARLGELRGAAPPLADLEDERLACLAARDRGRRQLAALEQAARLIEQATRGVHRELAPRLADSVAGRLSLLTEGRYTAVNVDTAHFEVSLLAHDRPDLVPLELLSHGTRDQVALLLRLALAEVLSGGGEPVPLLLDEPLLSADPQRRATALRFLWNLSATNQVVLSTSDPAMVAAIEDCCGDERPTVIELPSVAPVFETVGRAGAQTRLL